MPQTILLVDDDPIARKVIERIITTEPRLRSLEPRIIHAGDGNKGLAALAAERPDLVIVDLFMPNMDGFAFCRELRHSRKDEIPLLVISGVYKDPTMTGQLVSEFQAAFLPKPLAAAALADAILSLIKPREIEPLSPPTPEILAIGASSSIQAQVPPLATPAPAVAASYGDMPATSSSASMEVLAPATQLTIRPDSQSGSLADRNVPRLLFDQFEARATGALVLVRGQMKKEIFLRDGRAVAADSNLRQEALGSLLQAKGIINEGQLQHLLGEAKKRGQKMGTVLVELGWMTPEEVLNYLAAQARKRINDCLRWSEGTWMFQPGDSFSDRVIEQDIDIAALIFKGLLRTASPETLLERFDQDGERPIRLAPRLDTFRDAFEAVCGREVLPLLAGTPTLGSLMLRENSSGLVAAVDVLLWSGLADLAEPIAATAAPKKIAESSALLERLSESSTQMLVFKQGPFDDTFTSEAHLALDKIFPAEARTSSAPFSQVAPMDDSGVVELFAPTPTHAGVGPTLLDTELGRADPKNALLREYLEIHGKSLYDVLGVAFSATQEEIACSYQEKLKRFGDEAYAGIDLGSDISKLQAVRAAHLRAFKALSDPSMRQGYDTSRASRLAGQDAFGAELAFGEGIALLQAGNTVDALARFETAVTARPDQAVYHAYYGWTLFLARGAMHIAEVRDRLTHALALDPDLARAHEFLGRLALEQGDFAVARVHLEHALESDPTQDDLTLALIDIYGKLDDPRGAEKFYRRVISALGERAPVIRRRLWRELGDLFEHKLGERENARVAYEMAARLGPDDVLAQRKVVQLNAADPSRWRESGRALTAQWQQSPGDRNTGAALVEFYLKVGHADAAALAASAMVLRGLASDEHQQLADQSRPRVLQPLEGPLDPLVMARLGYGSEDPELEALIGLLAEGGLVEPFSPQDLGLGSDAPLAAAQQPAPFRQALAYAAGVLGVPEPAAVYRHPGLDADARLADMRPYALLTGPGLLESDDSVELGFRLGRALAFGTPARITGSSRAGRQLRPYLLAALAWARGSSTADPEAKTVLERIAASDPRIRQRLAEAGMRLIHSRQHVNLSAWSRALNRTAGRTGLLLSADLLRVGRAVAEEGGPEALEELLSFALSLDHLDLREELGRPRAI